MDLRLVSIALITARVFKSAVISAWRFFYEINGSGVSHAEGSRCEEGEETCVAICIVVYEESRVFGPMRRQSPEGKAAGKVLTPVSPSGETLLPFWEDAGALSIRGHAIGETGSTFCSSSFSSHPRLPPVWSRPRRERLAVRDAFSIGRRIEPPNRSVFMIMPLETWKHETDIFHPYPLTLIFFIISFILLSKNCSLRDFCF